MAEIPSGSADESTTVRFFALHSIQGKLFATYDAIAVNVAGWVLYLTSTKALTSAGVAMLGEVLGTNNVVR